MSIWLKQLDNDLTIVQATNFQEVETHLNNDETFDLVMLDLGMPGMQGALSVKQFCQLAGQTPLIVVSADESPLVIHSCMSAGASGYVTKSSDGEVILQAARQVLSGAEYIPLSARLYEAQPQFSDKQIQLLALLAEGLSNKDIAGKIHLSEGTVKQYVSQILTILDVDNRTQAGNRARALLGIGIS